MDDRKIRNLNLRFLKKNSATDVLAFDIGRDKKELFADIFISVDTARRNSGVFGTTVAREIYLYIIHGVLHLLGFEHKNAKLRRIMQKKEKQFLSWLYTEQRQ